MSVATLGLLAGLGGWAPPAHADYRVTCASDNNQYTRCRLDEPGFVTLRRQLSKTPCAQGRSWDWDRREVWVDDGCRAEFEVSTSSHGKGHSDGDAAKVAAGVIVGAAILGALAHNKDHRDDDKYRDDNYHGGRHTSYVPGWMVGTFRGYNPMYGADVEMTIADDGRVTAFADGTRLSGYINDDRLHVGPAMFDIDQIRGGFVTSQVGERHNEVRYQRVR
ncbi:MAG: DUF3011 domain-containing protein [Xanthomonadales bacterium]|nr:DUF3011 domain-containing protein [Xanthomonadales bacterium]